MKVALNRVRIIYPHVFTPQPAKEAGKKDKYNASFLIAPDHPAVPQIQKAMLDAANEQWKGNGLTVLQALESSKKCLRQGNNNLDNTGAVRNGFKDQLYLVASNTVRPTVFDRNRAPLVESDNKIYGGCWVNVIVDIYAMDDPKVPVKGVFATLMGLQFVADDEPLGSGPSVASADEFDMLQEEPSAADPALTGLGL